MKKVLLLLIRFYQCWISPSLGNNCKFYPTCSDYGYSVVQKYGFWMGSWLTAKRIVKCNPWHKGGHDPAP